MINSVFDTLKDKLEGKVEKNYKLAPYTRFGVGGPADIFVKAVSVSDLKTVVENVPVDVPILVIGMGSNLLVRDGGIRGVVIKLSGEFSNIEKIDDLTFKANAGVNNLKITNFAMKEEIANFEWLEGIPGTIGGAFRTNAGAHGFELKDVLVSAEIMDREGNQKVVESGEFNFGYRRSDFPNDWIILSAVLKGEKGNKDEIKKRMLEIREKRMKSQPFMEKTAGSTFANLEGKSAWQAIVEAGANKLTVGGAKVSDMHANFLINTGDASASDIEELGEQIRNIVKEKSAYDLRWEIKILGDKL
jgi:UDP-N-acetylmuramate dehydrogenase